MDRTRKYLPVINGANCPAPTRKHLPLQLLLPLLLLFSTPALRAELQFDVFVGFSQGVPDASWFPVVCEVFNDGPSFNGTVEISAGIQSNQRRMAAELPTGTRKRFVIPVFAPARFNGTWNARLLDEKGRVRSEQLGLMGKSIARQVPLMGSLTGRNPPTFPEPQSKNRRQELQPWAARLQADTFPDHSIALEGLHSLHLSSGKALENSLNPSQVTALLSWLHAGGHLILTVEQTTHVNGTDWLRQLVPVRLTDKSSVPSHPGLQSWVAGTERFDGTHYHFDNPNRSSENPFADLKPDPAFERQPIEVANATLRDGSVLIGPEQQPLAVTAPRGRGRITVLLFDPDKEPFRSWKNRAYFWAKMADLPPELFLDKRFDHYSPYSVDGVIGAMIDSKQIRKLPVAALLVLLVAYLIVIGPLDRYWLKKINRQMLTWITFPCYVLLFSGLIYFIGYKLRAGESEWNELHIVDLIPLPSGSNADFRGRTYASVYSPVNATYNVSSDQPLATFRGELLSSRTSAGSSATVTQRGDSFDAQISVPVWTSQLFVSDWFNKQRNPLGCSVTPAGSGYDVNLTNHLDQSLSVVKLVVGNRVFDLSSLSPGESLSTRVGQDGKPLDALVNEHLNKFQGAHNSRQRAFGDNTGNLIPNLPTASVALSFLETAPPSNNQNFLSPAGFDLTSLLRTDHAVLLAWVNDHGPTKSLNDFKVRHTTRNTLFRLAIPIPQD